MHLHCVWPFHGKFAFLCVVKEAYRFDLGKAGNNQPALPQNQAVDSYRSPVFISLKLNGAASQLKGLQRFCAFGSAEDDCLQKKKGRNQQQGSEEDQTPNSGSLMQTQQRSNGEKRNRVEDT